MFDLLNEFDEGLEPHKCIALLPVSRLIVDSPFRLDRFVYLPAGEVDLARLKLEKPLSLDEVWHSPDDCVVKLQGEELRRVATSLTGANEEIFDGNASIAFVADRPSWADGERGHLQDIGFISILAQKAERSMDLIRYHFCRFDLPDTLPGPIGTWAGSGTYCCAVICDRDAQKSELVAGEALYHSSVARGLGLELDDVQCASINGDRLPAQDDGEVGGIAQHALRLFTEVMNSNTKTAKFIRAMSLLEFLARPDPDPDHHVGFSELKREIAAHVASSKQEYDRLLVRFQELSKDLRTRLVHHGQLIEEVVPDESCQRGLFRELQHYTGKVIRDIVEMKTGAWSQIEEYRKARRQKLGDDAKAMKRHSRSNDGT